MWRIIVLLVACHSAPAPVIAHPDDAVAQHYDDGITRCGPAVPPPVARPAFPPMPEREPVPSFVAPRGDIDGGLSSDGILRAITTHASRFRVCFLKLLQHDNRRGSFRVTLNFQVVEDGSVAGIEVHGGGETMDRCICEEAEHIRIPPFDGRASVSFPLNFTDSLL